MFPVQGLCSYENTWHAPRGADRKHLGVDIIAKAREIIVQMDSLKAMISDDKTSIEGSYRLAVIPTLAPYVLPLFLQSFMTEFTHVTIIVNSALFISCLKACAAVCI